MTTTALHTTAVAPATADLRAIALTAALGLGLIFAAGFSSAAVLHDASHDQRHAIAFPCH